MPMIEDLMHEPEAPAVPVTAKRTRGPRKGSKKVAATAAPATKPNGNGAEAQAATTKRPRGRRPGFKMKKAAPAVTSQAVSVSFEKLNGKLYAVTRTPVTSETKVAELLKALHI